MNYRTLFVAVLFVTLNACGGGGSDNGGITSPAPSVAITTNNSDQVAATAGSADSITTSATSLVPLSVGQASQTTLNLTDFARRLLHLGSNYSLQALTVTQACPGGGSLTGPDPGSTSGTFTFTSCVGYQGNTSIDGSITFSLSGDASSNYAALITFNNLTITSGANVVTINVSMNISGNITGTVETTTVSYSLFNVTYNSDYVNIYNYKSTITYNNASLDYSISWDYTFDSSLINGAVKVSTETPIQGNDNNLYPYTGSLVVTGANNSHVRVSTNNSTGLPTDLVMIEVDADGDGIYESSKSVEWQNFDVGQVTLY